MVMQAKQRAETLSSSHEQREFKQNVANLPGSLIVPAEDAALPCQVLNLSGVGAGVRCEDPPPLHTYVILYIDGFGRLEAVIRRFVEGELSLQFAFNEAKRQRLLDKIYNYANDGVTGKTGLRRHSRLPSISNIRFTLRSGAEFHCEIIDVSVQGLSLRTDIRPSINELISIGQKCGRVVRHHSEGIAVDFSDMTDGQSHGR